MTITKRVWSATPINETEEVMTHQADDDMLLEEAFQVIMTLEKSTFIGKNVEESAIALPDSTHRPSQVRAQACSSK